MTTILQIYTYNLNVMSFDVGYCAEETNNEMDRSHPLQLNRAAAVQSSWLWVHFGRIALSCFALSCVVLSCFALSCVALSCFAAIGCTATFCLNTACPFKSARKVFHLKWSLAISALPQGKIISSILLWAIFNTL